MYKPVMKVIVHGREQELYTIGEVARRLKKSVETIRAWERQQIIPKPLYKSKNVRLYHPDEVDVMKKVIRKLGKYAKKQDVQKEMWTALAAVRKEILSGPEQNETSPEV